MVKKCLTAIFSLFALLVSGLIFSACGSSVDVSSVKSAEDTERKMGVEQYKPAPEPKPEPKPTSQEPPRKTTDTKPTPTTPTPEPTITQPAPSVTRSQSDTYLPDFKAFVNNKAEFNLDYDDNSKKAHYNIAASNDKYSTDDLIQEYINLITSKYNFRLIGSDNDTFPRYGFVYTGTGSVKQFTERHIVSYEDKVNVRITFFGGGKAGGIDEVVIRYADGINYTDTGDRTRYQIEEVKHNPQPSSGGGSSFDYPSGPDMRIAADEIKDRMCFRCDGRGYIEEFEYYNGPRYGEPPPPGVTVKKTCPDCNGRGRIELNW